MKFKKIIILFSLLSFQIYRMEPFEPAKTSAGNPKKSVRFESKQDAAKRTQAENEQSAAKKQQAAQSDASKVSSTQPQSILKTSSDDSTTGATVKFTDGSSELSTDHLDPFEAGKEGAVDYGEVDSNKNHQIEMKNTNINARLAPEVTPKIAADFLKSLELNKQKKQDEKDASTKLAKDLESKARAAKTDADIKNIVMDDIDPTGKLTPEIIDDAIQASKIWRDPFNGSSWEHWFDALSRITSYLRTGKPVPDEFVAELKNLVDANKGKIKSQKEIDDKIAAKDDAIDAQSRNISDIQTQIQIHKADIETHVAINYTLPTRAFGDSQAVVDLESQIAKLEKSLPQEQQNLSVLVHEMSGLVHQKSVINGGDIPGLEQDAVDSSVSNEMSSEKKKQESLCDTVEACVEKIKDPNDASSLSSILTQVGELAKDPAVMNKFSKEQQDAVNFFVKNGDKIINKFSTLTIYETSQLLYYKNKLPTAKGSEALNTSVLITKSEQEVARVQAERQQKVPPVDLFAPASAVTAAAA